jgi:hypothetical protein
VLNNSVPKASVPEPSLTLDPASWKLADGKFPFGVPDLSRPTRYFSLQQVANAVGATLYEIEKLFEMGAIPGQCFRGAPRSRQQGRRIRAIKALEYVIALRDGDYAWLTSDAYDNEFGES